MVFERNFGYFLIIAAAAIVGAVAMSLMSPLALILAASMVLAGLGFIRQVRLEAELINRTISRKK